MDTLEQFNLLEQKIESAVAKIQQLQAENDALRNKCAELTNALSAKSEQLSDFQTDKNIIETGIQKALDRLNSIENSVLKTNVQSPSFFQAPVTETVPVSEPQFTNQPQQSNLQENPVQSEPVQAESMENQFSNAVPDFGNQSFDSMSVLNEETIIDESEEDENPNGGDFGFDIF